MNNQSDGLLAIWSTIATETEVDYLHWLTREHIFERVGVPGFLSGRVFKRRDRSPSEYLMLYELASADVMSSDGYLARLNAPTPWTQKIMPALMHFRRGGGVTHTANHGRAYGTHIAVARFEDSMPEALVGLAGQKMLDDVVGLDWIVAARAMAVKTDATSIATREKSMRSSQEGAFSGLLVIEALDHSSLNGVESLISRAVPGGCNFQRYDTIFSHHRIADIS
ncbi:hypothetical protein NOV72_03011 [Caballeronia novacaledonica]|uniref:Uncharacterized protein n=1 Tax=Caballeronia novacaledonica TaxID=1544861 RepID=A0A2U3I6K6_9BURK|nr:DUF4286 family protein [Caballeronia novacaledonica]SPB15805.1 hypothetical protein NOV72_03011 [Caballeronia novacaledonica]